MRKPMHTRHPIGFAVLTVAIAIYAPQTVAATRPAVLFDFERGMPLGAEAAHGAKLGLDLHRHPQSGEPGGASTLAQSLHARSAGPSAIRRRALVPLPLRALLRPRPGRREWPPRIRRYLRFAVLGDCGCRARGGEEHVPVPISRRMEMTSQDAPGKFRFEALQPGRISPTVRHPIQRKKTPWLFICTGPIF